ncbi:hypothetical protein IWQ55_002014 [Labrenzia sp. EL_208]|uniref:Uncharacterized protein n=1 Tax=Roseibium album TaxID=311410 RepID=A0A0M6ZES6_9HYPH|nr:MULTISPECIES: hypothetical protein [Stappiaceae]MBG6145330.1 hypothetical protein [Labrenzia sp. EL_142]MBG6155284.1 hypothetical protein [Labrenzia sp. EL_162]MBG6162543.1 hypothetical protein [Labrenzia sp. EL_195]MBG6173735.1 hypothetical protein [Labrenzia sp. EL_132]MBG6192587.1 hypothetical protein [Labrenzia sp. EL_159]MBG6198976.1 hypothetical protein [Labrenzia sp. EL_13]MBG6207076.1 hypothetical protein [Labrenzia sp. EL_126]MBG6228809.1 hypothetical protein [Labrenzia sp. EL_2
MIKLRERLDTPEALMAAIEGYQHLSIDVLSQFLLDNYTVDLDVLAQFADALEASASNTVHTTSEPSKSAQSAA